MVEAKFETFRLSEETKENIGNNIGMSLDKLAELDADAQFRYIEDKVGKALSYPRECCVDGLPIRTIDEIEILTK